MEKLLSQQISTIGLAITIAGIVIAIFKWANNTVSEEIKDNVALWILGEHRELEWNKAAVEIYKIVFGRRSWSIRSIFVVAVTTTLIGFASYVWLTKITEGKLALISGGPTEWLVVTPFLAIYSLPVALLSAAKTRFLLERIANATNLLFAASWLAIDIALYAGVAYGWFEILLGIPVSSDENTSRIYEIGDTIGSVFMISVAFPLTLFSALAATILPSFLGCIVFGTLAVKYAYAITSRMSGRLSNILSRQRLEKEPVLLIGEMIAGSVFLIICVMGLT